MPKTSGVETEKGRGPGLLRAVASSPTSACPAGSLSPAVCELEAPWASRACTGSGTGCEATTSGKPLRWPLQVWACAVAHLHLPGRFCLVTWSWALLLFNLLLWSGPSLIGSLRWHER